MGEADRFSDYQRPRRRLSLGDDGNALVGLVTINIMFFLLLLVIQVVYFFFQTDRSLFNSQVLNYFQLPAALVTLSERPWTLLTSMFTHVNIIHILSNMIWLWVFGYILQGITGNRKLIPIYIYGGLAGALVFILASYSIPPLKPYVQNSWLIGGNASIMAVAMATTVLAPNYRFFQNLNGGIPIWVFTLIYVFIDFAGVATQGAAISLSHLGGAGAGYLFVFFLRRGRDGSLWMLQFYDWIINLFNPNKKGNDKDIRQKVFYNSDGRKPYKKTSNVTQQRVDEILDKINQKGFHFLTDEEKSILKRAAEEDLN